MAQQRMLLESPNDLLNRGEAARILGVKPQTLAVWVTTKRYGLPFVKIGSLVKYKRRDLDQFIERQTANRFNDK
jgi:excisionase family DNA binding protein